VVRPGWLEPPPTVNEPSHTRSVTRLGLYHRPVVIQANPNVVFVRLLEMGHILFVPLDPHP